MKNQHVKLINAQHDQPPSLILTGVIGSWWDDNELNQVLDRLSAINADYINVYLSSEGGYFIDGLPIGNFLQEHPAYIHMHVMGYALSMASSIIVKADRVTCAPDALIMIHNAQGMAYGNKRDMQATADVMHKHDLALVENYRSRLSNHSDEEILTLLDNETWFTAKEALDVGLIDDIADISPPVKPSSSNNLNNEFVSRFKNAPSGFLATNQNQKRSGFNLPWRNTKTKDTAMQPAEIDKIADVLAAKLNNTSGGDNTDKARITELEKDLQAKTDALEQAQAQLATAKANSEQLEKDLQAKTTALNAMQAEVSELKSEVADLKKPDGSGTKPPKNSGAANKYNFGEFEG